MKTYVLACSLTAMAYAFAPMPMTPTRAAPLEMAGGNLVDRFFRVSRANLNKVISSLEDPEKVVIQAVTDMQNDLIRIRQAYAQATASQRRNQRELDQLENQAKAWYNRAQLALQNGKDDLAKEALTRRQAFTEQADVKQQQIDTQQAATDKLFAAMTQLEGKIQEASAKKQQLVTRAQTAKSTQKVNDMLSGLTGKTSMDAFGRMEEKVEALEAAAEASAELALPGGSTTSTLELEFQMLEASSEVDTELDRMKQDLKFLGSSSSAKPADRRIPISIEKVQAQ